MINQMSRHLVRLVKVGLEFHLCVCSWGWCMLCLFSNGMGDPIHRQSSGGLQFWRSQRPEINNPRNEHTTKTQHVRPIFCLRLCWHWTGYGCIIQCDGNSLVHVRRTTKELLHLKAKVHSPYLWFLFFSQFEGFVVQSEDCLVTTDWFHVKVMCIL